MLGNASKNDFHLHSVRVPVDLLFVIILNDRVKIFHTMNDVVFSIRMSYHCD